MEEKELLSLKSKANLNCKICDKCCEYRGDIKITPINVLEISNYLKISIDEFLEKYTETAINEEPEIVIKAVGDKNYCIFNDRQTFKCRIHAVEPMQCLVFPLVPWDLEKDLFINSNQCVLKDDKKIKVGKWLNENNKIYKRNKLIYQKWIELMEEIQPWWKIIPSEKQDKIKSLLYNEYDINKNFEKQVLKNIEEVRKIYGEGYFNYSR